MDRCLQLEICLGWLAHHPQAFNQLIFKVGRKKMTVGGHVLQVIVFDW